MTTVELIIDLLTFAAATVAAYYGFLIAKDHSRRLKFLQDQVDQLRDQVSTLTRVQNDRDREIEALKKKTGDMMTDTIRKLMELPEIVRKGVRDEMNDIISKMP